MPSARVEPVEERSIAMPITPRGGGSIGSMELSRLFTDEDLLVERPLVTYGGAPASSAPTADASADAEKEDDWLPRTMWEVTCVGFGAEFGNAVGGSKAMAVVCGVAALVWSRRRWPG